MFVLLIYLIFTANTLLISLGALAGLGIMVYIILRQSKIIGREVSA